MKNDSLEQTMFEKSFSTFDLGLASALVSKGYQIQHLENMRDKKVRFVFQNSTELKESINKYWNGNLKVSARTFFENQKMLKNRIYSE